MIFSESMRTGHRNCRRTKARGFAGDDAKALIVQLTQNEAGELSWESGSLAETTFEKVIGLFNEGVDQIRIAEELHVNKSTVSRHVKQGREQGLIGSLTCMSNAHQTNLM